MIGGLTNSDSEEKSIGVDTRKLSKRIIRVKNGYIIEGNSLKYNPNDPKFSTKAEEAMPFDPLPTLGNVNVDEPTEYNIRRVDNGYLIHTYNHTNIGPRSRDKTTVFGDVDQVVKRLKKHLDKLEEEIKIEKLKQ
jgi:hypothetical protein